MHFVGDDAPSTRGSTHSTRWSALPVFCPYCSLQSLKLLVTLLLVPVRGVPTFKCFIRAPAGHIQLSVDSLFHCTSMSLGCFFIITPYVIRRQIFHASIIADILWS